MQSASYRIGALIGALAIWQIWDTSEACAATASLTQQNMRAVAVDGSLYRVFHPKWWRPVVQTGLIRQVQVSFGRPAISKTHALVLVGSGEGQVVALSLKDGHVVWRFIHGAAFETAAQIVHIPWGQASDRSSFQEEVVILGSRDGTVVALDVKTGHLRWQTDVGADVRAPVVQRGDRVLVSTVSNKVVCLTLQTGKVLWIQGRLPPSGLTVEGHARLAVDGTRVVAAFSDGTAAALDIQAGTLVWTRPLGEPGWEALGSDSQSQSPWQRTELKDADADPFVRQGRLFMASYAQGVYALDPQTGAVLWKRQAPAVTSLAPAKDLVVAASAQGYVWGLSQKSGRVRFRTQLSVGPMSRMVVQKGWIVLTTGDDGLVVLDAATGRPVQAVAPAGYASGDPVWVQEDLAWISRNGYLYVWNHGLQARSWIPAV